jgi:hypothetical protein
MKIYHLSLFFFTTFIIVSLSNCIFFIIDPYERKCISQEMKEHNFFNGVYFVSGSQEEANKVVIEDSNGHIIWASEHEKNGSFNLEIKQPGK